MKSKEKKPRGTITCLCMKGARHRNQTGYKMKLSRFAHIYSYKGSYIQKCRHEVFSRSAKIVIESGAYRNCTNSSKRHFSLFNLTVSISLSTIHGKACNITTVIKARDVYLNTRVDQGKRDFVFIFCYRSVFFDICLLSKQVFGATK